MYIAFNEKQLKMLERIKKDIGIEFENINHLILIEDIIYALETLYIEYDRKKEELEDLEADLRDNYQPIPIKEQIGINDTDFI